MSKKIDNTGEAADAPPTPDELRGEVAAILARGLLRLRDRHALEVRPTPKSLPLHSEDADKGVTK
jgi:hypothetical protein